jgi:hypothetical protein
MLYPLFSAEYEAIREGTSKSSLPKEDDCSFCFCWVREKVESAFRLLFGGGELVVESSCLRIPIL